MVGASVRKVLVAAVAVCLLSAGCSGLGASFTDRSPEPAPTSAATEPSSTQTEQLAAARGAVTGLLLQRSQAFTLDNPRAFLATVRPEIRREQRVLFANLQALPVDYLHYEPISDTTFTWQGDRDDVLVGSIWERVKLRGADSGAVHNQLQLRLVKRNDRWLIAKEFEADQDEVQSRPWGGGPIVSERRGKLIVVTDRELAERAPRLADIVTAQIPAIADVLGVRPRSALVVDATSSGSRSRLGPDAKAVAHAVAFAVFSQDESATALKPTRSLAGYRVKFNPRQVAQLIEDEWLLRHELTHFLTGGSPGAPRWVEEGLAAYVSYYPTRPFGLVLPADIYEKVAERPRSLPNSREFGRAPTVDYLLAQCGATHLIDTYGMAKYTRFRTTFADTALYPDLQTRARLRKIYRISERQLIAGAHSTCGQFRRG